MDKIKIFFDDFTFHARVMPVLVMLLPIIILGCIKGILTNGFMDTTLYITIFVICLTVMSKMARNKGKAYEAKMYSDLGGKPTTILMRFSDTNINNVSKKKYHERLNQRLEGINLPLSSEEETEESDLLYEATINWLRNHATHNRKEEFRVQQELKEYNFWRNMYGIKYIGLVLYILIGIREYFMIEEFNINAMIKSPYPQYIALWCIIISIVVIVFGVNKKTVKDKAFDYSKTLIEVCERL
ncbi:hypothetical protein QTL86_18625 [Cellulosilyticum sp. ST5]|uniref:hypothetical protein n=1 Tax=Cellulosilyticum sp. ST5 TaxID=3055805 RepID=UPI0039772E2C